MGIFFGALHPHPARAAGELLVLAIGRHAEVAVRREQLVVDLLVDGVLHGLGKHDCGLLELRGEGKLDLRLPNCHSEEASGDRRILFASVADVEL
jgi:hypothetical protein